MPLLSNSQLSLDTRSDPSGQAVQDAAACSDLELARLAPRRSHAGELTLQVLAPSHTPRNCDERSKIEKLGTRERPSGHKICELLATASWLVGVMSADDTVVDEPKALARRHVRSLFERLALPTVSKGITEFSDSYLLDLAARYKAPTEMMSKLYKMDHDTLGWHVKKVFFSQSKRRRVCVYIRR